MKSTPLYPAMRAPHFVLRDAFVCLAGAVAGCIRFRRGFCVVIVAMRRNGQQLEGTHGRAREGVVARNATRTAKINRMQNADAMEQGWLRRGCSRSAFAVLKNSTCLSRFSASFLVLYGPPSFFLPFSDRTL
jgi:hypothetical protein